MDSGAIQVHRSSVFCENARKQIIHRNLGSDPCEVSRKEGAGASHTEPLKQGWQDTWESSVRLSQLNSKGSTLRPVCGLTTAFCLLSNIWGHVDRSSPARPCHMTRQTNHWERDVAPHVKLMWSLWVKYHNFKWHTTMQQDRTTRKGLQQACRATI